jgi:hypothetical protein
MQLKITLLTTLFALLFSLQTFSQAAEKSDHPLLDKYYPTPKKDTATVIAPATKPVVETKPVVRSQPAPVMSTEPVAPSTAPVVTSTTPVAASTAPVATSPNIPVETKPVVVTSIAPAIKADTAVKAPETAAANKIAPVTNPAPVKKAVAQPVTQPYRSTRLGSSSKLYDTWEKNNNGAGSVTTGSK